MSEEQHFALLSNDNARYPTTRTDSSTKTSTYLSAAAEQSNLTDHSTAADKKLKIMRGEIGKGVINLSEFQIDSLLNKLDLEMFDYYVSKLADHILAKGPISKSHYATILRWWEEDCNA